MAERDLSRPLEEKKINRRTSPLARAPVAVWWSARLESPPAKQLRVHPAAADGYRSRSGTPWSTRVFVETRPPSLGFFGRFYIERIRRHHATRNTARPLS